MSALEIYDQFWELCHLKCDDLRGIRKKCSKVKMWGTWHYICCISICSYLPVYGSYNRGSQGKAEKQCGAGFRGIPCATLFFLKSFFQIFFH
ncbi:MAG: hypothetical protein ACI9A1_001536, partial [Lentimonas sp.]